MTKPTPTEIKLRASVDPRVEKTAGVTSGALALACVLIAQFEGLVQIPYVDSLGKGKPLTVCYGSTINVIPTRRYSVEECKQMLLREARNHAEAIRPYLPPYLPDKTAAAFYDFGYNLFGSGPEFAKTSVSRKALAGDLIGACKAIMLYKYTSGKDCSVRANKCYGLIRRREAEVSLCLEGLGQ